MFNNIKVFQISYSTLTLLVTMSFTGKFLLETQEGFVEFMKAVGLPDDLIEKGKDIKSLSEIEHNGDQFKVTVTTGPKVLSNTFMIGQETEIENLTGEKVKAVVTKEGNKLKVVLNRVTSITELVDDNTIVNTMTLGDIVYKRVSKRVA
ncbi:fatty acid binding protein 1-B.1-like [Xyrauchen texanus]|uniref:fatty acid binding protein 1-B.1-like n=1 Tax=Xyrauchen texanus TaxID=154827 RepID=UPI002241D18D|nr:fatty acid binding protein 1-B.1-like [Xyrauchen texanus]